MFFIIFIFFKFMKQVLTSNNSKDQFSVGKTPLSVIMPLLPCGHMSKIRVKKVPSKSCHNYGQMTAKYGKICL